MDLKWDLNAWLQEEQRMGFHSDGERGVQGTIASLSLGSSATMKFQPLKSKKTPSKEKKCLQLELHHVCSVPRSAKELRILTQYQGDFLIMDGADIQRLYKVSYFFVVKFVAHCVQFPWITAWGHTKGIPLRCHCLSYRLLIFIQIPCSYSTWRLVMIEVFLSILVEGWTSAGEDVLHLSPFLTGPMLDLIPTLN